MQLFTQFYFLIAAVVITSTVALPGGTRNLARRMSNFSTELYQKCAESSDGNVLISPYSVASASALLSQGCNGETFNEISGTLNLPVTKLTIANFFDELSATFGPNFDDFTLSVANRVYVKEGSKIRDEFNAVASSKFNARAETLNFANGVESANEINRWVENSTHNKIKNLISPSALSADTTLLLVNVIYFKAFFQHAFYKPATAPGKFYINDQDAVDVQFMHLRRGFKYANLEALDATAVQFPYMGTAISFIVILPNKRHGLSELERKLNSHDLEDIIDQMHKAEVDVTLPKFKIEHEVKLNDVLQKMGMNTVFTDDADLRGLLETNGQSLKVSDVIHKAFIEVNEEGTEAAAATYFHVVPASFVAYNRKHTFNADHPFLFFVFKDNTSLFTGRVIKP